MDAGPDGGILDFPRWYPFAPHLALRERVRQLEPEFSLLWAWEDRVDEWREQLRARLVDLLGLGEVAEEEGAGPTPCGLDVRELEAVDCEGYSRTKVAYNVEVGVGTLAWVCVPHNNEQPLPAVVCAHPRGAGKDELVGLVGDSGPGWAGEMAQRGYVAVAPDLRCFGERRADEEGLRVAGDLVGRPLMGMQVWELLRAVDYLQQRPDVRADRVGIRGHGMGALAALFAAAVDERIRCAVARGGLGTFREWIVAGDCFNGTQPPADTVPGLLRYADLDDVACLIAPRALMLANDPGDGRVPTRGVEELHERVTAGFAAQGEQVKLETVMPEARDAEREEPLRFLDDWLKFP